MESQWKFGGLTPWDLSVRTAKQISEDDVFGRSAQLAYYFLLALFPLLLFLLSSLGYFAAAGEELRRKLFEYLGRMMPGSASQLVTQAVIQVIASRGSGKVVLGLLGALWAASNGVGAVIETLNIAYHVQETRPWWKKRSIAVGLTIALSLLIVLALTLALFGGKLAEVIGSHLAIGPAVIMAWKIVQRPVALGFMFLAFALVYYFAPNVKEPEWHWISP